MEAFLDDLSSIAERLPALAYDPPARCRDPKDDYLIEQPLRFNAEVVVTGDDDVLALDGTLPAMRILRPRALFVEIAPAAT